jgi:hypothetical protein
MILLNTVQFCNLSILNFFFLDTLPKLTKQTLLPHLSKFSKTIFKFNERTNSLSVKVKLYLR